MEATLGTEYRVWSCHRAGTFIGRRDGEASLPGFVRIYARQLWSWSGALAAPELGRIGPTGGKIGDWVHIEIRADDVCRLVDVSPEALAALERVPPWTP